MRRWAIVLLILTQGALAAEPPHLALVIANSQYATLPPLPACAASASLVTASLRRAGFDVREMRDPSNGQMGAAIGSFAEALAKAPDAAALVYVCGYAAGYEGRMFLLPASARLPRPTDILTEGMVVPVLTGVVARPALQAGLIVLDTFALPGTETVPPDSAALRAAADHKGLFAVSTATVGPNAPTPAATALGSALSAGDVEVGAALQGLQAAVVGRPGTTAFVQAPAAPSWLLGSPPAPPPAAPEPSRAPPEPTPPPAAAPAAPAASGPAVLNEADRRRVQLALQHLGYYDDKVDGVYGPGTLAAIRRFQHELGAEMTGRLTADQAARLLATP